MATHDSSGKTIDGTIDTKMLEETAMKINDWFHENSPLDEIPDPRK